MRLAQLDLPMRRRISWANSDIITVERVRIEVKASAYWQRSVQSPPCPNDSWNHCDGGNRVNLVPLRMKSVLHVTPHYPDPRADWREHNMVRIVLARTLSVLLRHGKPAYDFEHEVTVLIAHVAGIQ